MGVFVQEEMAIAGSEEAGIRFAVRRDDEVGRFGASSGGSRTTFGYDLRFLVIHVGPGKKVAGRKRRPGEMRVVRSTRNMNNLFTDEAADSGEIVGKFRGPDGIFRGMSNVSQLGGRKGKDQYGSSGADVNQPAAPLPPAQTTKGNSKK